MATDIKRIDDANSHQNFCSGFARTNLDACFIFSELAKRELQTGMRGQAERFFRRAKCSYEASLQLLNRVENGKNEVQKKIECLGEKLDFLRQELNQGGALTAS